MSQTVLNPYLTFNNNAREAMDFYHQVFGGKLDMQTFGDFGDKMPPPPGHENNIMHANLEADAIRIMASDGRPDQPPKIGDNISLSLSGSDAHQLKGYFSALAEGGAITMPMERQAWGDEFGMCTDKFGINWMINVNQQD